MRIQWEKKETEIGFGDRNWVYRHQGKPGTCNDYNEENLCLLPHFSEEDIKGLCLVLGVYNESDINS